jgi:hypothetical protein
MDAKRIEVKRILSQNAPTIQVRTRRNSTLRRVADYSLRLSETTLHAIKNRFPKRAYLTLD